MDNSAREMTPYSGTDNARRDHSMSGRDPFATANSENVRRLAETLHPVWSVEVLNHEVTFEKPVVFKVMREGPHFVAENTYLDLSAVGESVSEALNEAISDLSHFCEHYTRLGEDEVLGFGAQLRERFVQLVDRKD